MVCLESLQQQHGGNFYCTGIYSTFDLKSTIHNSITKKNTYGDAIIKMGIKSYDRFFILNKSIAQQVYGDKFRPEEQLEMLFDKRPDILRQLKSLPSYGRIIQTTHRRTAGNVQELLTALGGMHCRADGKLNELDIRGFVFYGENDGNVAIIRDFKGIVPLSYSLDNGRTWKKDLFNDRTYQNTAKDHDPIIFLGGEEVKYANPSDNRVINGFMKVQRKRDKKFNLIDAETKDVVSPIWFDDLSNMDDNGFATAVSRELMDNDDFFYINKYGCYEKPRIDTLIVFFDDL